MLDNIAHVKQEKGEWVTQSLTDHLEGVAGLAGEFAESFGNKNWAEFLGLVHDLGKFVPDWQKHIRKDSGFESESADSGSIARVHHSTAGAVLAFERFKNCKPLARAMAYPIAGHHAGLPDWDPDKAGGDLQNRLYHVLQGTLNIGDLEKIRQVPEASRFLELSLPRSSPCNGKLLPEHTHLWIRMLFSCLVDADFLDTEGFMEPDRTAQRGGYPELRALKEVLDRHLEDKGRNVPDTKVNRFRREVLARCQEKAKLPSGFFTLTVPTGGGKTLSSMAFALDHALKHGKSRVIMAIPYTSIIEQTAKVYKYGSDNEETIRELKRSGGFLFGEEAVVEHHSNLDPDRETLKNRLASENWDAPIVVTTNVRLFESLFAAQGSSCRKLHNLVDSVIILDEAQMLPPAYLKPILSVLKGLVEHYGVTVLLCTATQPSLTGKIGTGKTTMEGLPDCTEIVDDPVSLSRKLDRVEISFPDSSEPPSEWEEIAERLQEHEKVLCIVNTRKDCRALHSLMPEGTVHLSALMCGEERSEVISRMKEKLRRDGPLRVISTQLVEAGVDIDFPVVFRAMAGMDSIAQASGRCNREERLSEKGRVVVFSPPKSAPTGLLRKGEDATRTILRQGFVEGLSPELFGRYFTAYYASLNELDKPRFKERLVDEAYDFKFQFRTFAKDFNLIDNESQRGIVVWYEAKNGNSSLDLIERLRREGPNRYLLRKLQRFTVNVSASHFRKIDQVGYVEEIHGYYVQSADGLYRPGLGLLTEEEDWVQQVHVT